MSQIETQIASAKEAGHSDQEIFQAILKSPKYGLGFEKARASGLSNDEIAKGLGLVVKAVNNASNRRNYKPFDNTKEARTAREKEALKKQGKTSFWESGLLGLADLGVPVVQAAEYAADGIRSASNKVLGTDFETDRYEKVTKTHKDINRNHETVRKANNQGIDVTRIGANILTTAPLAAAGGTLKAGQALTSKAGMEFLGKNAALGAALGATGVHENNTERLKSMGLGAVGGAVGAGVGQKAGEALSKGINRAKTTANNTMARVSTERTNQILQNIDDKLTKALESQGLKMADLGDDALKVLRADAKKALDAGKNLNAEAVARKVVLDRVGIKGTRAQVTGNAQQWQKEAELAKVAGIGDPLREKFISDNIALEGLLGRMTQNTGGKAIDQHGAIETATETLLGKNAQNKEYIKSIYDSARQASGNDAVLDGGAFAKEAKDLLEQSYATMSLPPSVNKILKDIEKKPQEFTLNKAEEVIKALNREYKASLMNGQPTSSTHAIGLVRDSLNSRQAQALQGLTGNESAQLYQLARQAHKTNAQLTETLPLLKDTLKGVPPDKLFNKHVLKGNVGELGETVSVLKNTNPQAVADIKQQTLEYITSKSMNSNGQFSPAGMNNALKSIGDRRLGILFEPSELKHIKDIGRAGHYLVTQPNHSYVNNSNTAAGLMRYFGGLAKVAEHVPVVGNNIVQPLQSGAQKVGVHQALKGGSLAGDAIPATPANQALIDRIVKSGMLGGANLQD